MSNDKHHYSNSCAAYESPQDLLALGVVYSDPLLRIHNSFTNPCLAPNLHPVSACGGPSSNLNGFATANNFGNVCKLYMYISKQAYRLCIDSDSFYPTLCLVEDHHIASMMLIRFGISIQQN